MTDTASQPKTVDRVVVGLFATHYAPGTDAAGNPTTLVRTAQRGEKISVTEAEAQRLEDLGAVVDLGREADADASRQAALDRYRADRGDQEAVAAVARAVAPTDPIVDVTTPQPSVSPPPLGVAPTGSVTTGDTGGPDTPPAAGADTSGGIVRADAPDPETASAGEIAEWISTESPNVDDTVSLASGDSDLAAKVLEAENIATGGDPRKGVESKLAPLADGA